MNIYNKYKEQYDNDQQTNKSYNLYRKSLQDNVMDKNKHESLCNNFIKNVVETKNESFL